MTNRNQPIEPDGVAPPMGPHTHAWRVPAGAEWLYISGQVAVDQSGQVVGPGDIGAQVQQVFRNVEGVLVGAGFEFADVVKFTTYLVRAEDMEAYRKARAAVYDSCFPTNGSRRAPWWWSADWPPRSCSSRSKRSLSARPDRPSGLSSQRPDTVLLPARPRLRNEEPCKRYLQPGTMSIASSSSGATNGPTSTRPLWR